MAAVEVCTPVKGRQFSIRAAGSRMPMTPSPKTVQNRSIGTPESIHSSSAFVQSINRSAIKKSGKSNITATCSPRRLDLGISEWTLTGTGSKTPGKIQQNFASNIRPKSSVRIPYNAVDRFIPNRTASVGICNVGVTRIENGKSADNSNTTNKRFGSSVLAAGAADAFDIGRSYGWADLSMDNLSGNEADCTINGGNCNRNNSYQTAPPLASSMAYESSIASACGVSLNTRILAFKPAPPESNRPIDLRSQYNRPLRPVGAIDAQQRRRVLTSPERVLDAPGIIDDYYLNLLDWSCGNQVAIGLGQTVYVWTADTASVTMLMETSPDTYVASLKWSDDGAYVCAGLGTGEVQIWDVEKSTKLRSMSGHESRVSTLAWSSHILSTGARNGWLFNHDVRVKKHKVATLESHTGEVCGLEWRSDGSQLASGGNDNLVCVWDARSLHVPKFAKTNHNAAVKALAWCPWQLNLLATGGGSNDRHIHFWNGITGARVNSIDTGSQVTSLRWSTCYKEIVSTSGFPANSVSIWAYPSLVKQVEIPAHESRVLHSCLSPDGQTLATAAADESLKFWKVFEKKAGVPNLGNVKSVSSMTGAGVLR